MLNESTDAADKTVVQLVSIDDVIDEILAQGETADRIALHLELVAAEHEIETGRGVDLSDMLTRLRAERHS